MNDENEKQVYESNIRLGVVVLGTAKLLGQIAVFMKVILFFVFM